MEVVYACGIVRCILLYPFSVVVAEVVVGVIVVVVVAIVIVIVQGLGKQNSDCSW